MNASLSSLFGRTRGLRMHALAMSSLQCYESYEFFLGWTIDMTNGEKSVNPLRDEASLKRSGKNFKVQSAQCETLEL